MRKHPLLWFEEYKIQQHANIRWIRVVFFGVGIQHELSCVGNWTITTCLLLSIHRSSCCQIWHHLLFLRCELFPILVHRTAPQAIFCCLLFLRAKEANPWHIPQSEQKHHRVWSGTECDFWWPAPVHLYLPSQLGEYKRECDDVCNAGTEGQKKVTGEIIFANGVMETLFLDDSSFDPGFEGEAVF